MALGNKAKCQLKLKKQLYSTPYLFTPDHMFDRVDVLSSQSPSVKLTPPRFVYFLQHHQRGFLMAPGGVTDLKPWYYPLVKEMGKRSVPQIMA